MNFLHERDLGDIILSLASVKASGGGNYYIQNNPNALKILSPLIESQSYINKCGGKFLHKIDKSFVDFRKNGHPWGVPLAELHAKWIGVNVDFSKPWLSAPKDKRFKGSIIVNKTQRYNNPLFPWAELVNTIGERMIFVGLDSEYDLFCKRFGYIDRYKVKNYLELATAINSSDCFIGNQSSANCVAEGLKHRSILEVCLWMPDCIYKRDNATFCYDGMIDTKIGDTNIVVSKAKSERYVNKSVTPSGGWRITVNGKTIKSYAIDSLVLQAQGHGLTGSRADIESMIVTETMPHIAIDPISERLLYDIDKVKKLIG